MCAEEMENKHCYNKYVNKLSDVDHYARTTINKYTNIQLTLMNFELLHVLIYECVHLEVKSLMTRDADL